jgi:hypothetical protein
VLKLTTFTEFSFDASVKIEEKVIDFETTVKQKAGIRGKIQQNAAEDKLDYVEKALDLALKYTFMTKGELLDFIARQHYPKRMGLPLYLQKMFMYREINLRSG